MKSASWFSAIALCVIASSAAKAQDFPKPGPEHEMLKKMEGNWDLTMKMEGMEMKGTQVYKMDLGGLWLAGAMESEFAGTKFSGRSMDTYDPAKKKYVSVWMDNMTTSPMFMEGTLDAKTKQLTMSGDGPGMDGKPMKYRSVSTMPDDDTINFSMYMGDAKEPAFTIVYKRKK